MKQPTTIPEQTCVSHDDAATLYALDDQRFQAMCAVCLRLSPVIGGGIENALVQVCDLGWTTASGSGWTCPLCEAPESGRYSLP